MHIKEEVRKKLGEEFDLLNEHPKFLGICARVSHWTCEIMFQVLVDGISKFTHVNEKGQKVINLDDLTKYLEVHWYIGGRDSENMKNVKQDLTHIPKTLRPRN